MAGRSGGLRGEGEQHIREEEQLIREEGEGEQKMKNEVNPTQALKGMSVMTLIFVVVAVTTLIGIAILTQVGDAYKVNTYASENITLDNGTAVSLTHDEVVSTISFVLLNATNTSQIIPVSNYTVSYIHGTVTLDDPTVWDGKSANARYTYRADTSVTTAAVLFTAGLAIFATFGSLLILVVIGKYLLVLIKG